MIIINQQHFGMMCAHGQGKLYGMEFPLDRRRRSANHDTSPMKYHAFLPGPENEHVKPRLVGSWATPLKNMSSSIGMMKFPKKMGNKIDGNQTTNQMTFCFMSDKHPEGSCVHHNYVKGGWVGPFARRYSVLPSRGNHGPSD